MHSSTCPLVNISDNIYWHLKISECIKRHTIKQYFLYYLLETKQMMWKLYTKMLIVAVFFMGSEVNYGCFSFSSVFLICIFYLFHNKGESFFGKEWILMVCTLNMMWWKWKTHVCDLLPQNPCEKHQIPNVRLATK